MFGFDWNEANLRHIALHSVTPEEAEEAGPTQEIDSHEAGVPSRGCPCPVAAASVSISRSIRLQSHSPAKPGYRHVIVVLPV